MNEYKQQVLSTERKAALFDNAIEVCLELYRDEDLYEMLHESIGLTVKEIKAMGYLTGEDMADICQVPQRMLEGNMTVKEALRTRDLPDDACIGHKCSVFRIPLEDLKEPASGRQEDIASVLNARITDVRIGDGDLELLLNGLDREVIDRLHDALEERKLALHPPRPDPFAVLRVIAGVKTNCVLLDGNDANTPEVAACFTHYFENTADTLGCPFEKTFTNREAITEEEYASCVFRRLGYDKHVACAFDIDLDDDTFSILDAKEGWTTFPAGDIRAATHRLEECGVTDPSRLDAEFRGLLRGKRIKTPARFFLLRGDEPILPGALDICECLGADEEIVTFYADLLAEMQDVFGADVAVGDNSRIEIHAFYDTEMEQVCNTLDVILLRPGSTIKFACDLPPETGEDLKGQMDECCVSWCGKHLAELQEQEALPQTGFGLEQNI